MARRIRCVRCKELTKSGWHLTYKEGKKDFEGVHCFKCKTAVIGDRQEKRTPDMVVSIR